jgi:hypothetical protein
MTSRSDRQCFTFQRQASPKESSFRPMSIVCISSRKRGRRTNGNFRFGRANARFPPNCDIHRRDPQCLLNVDTVEKAVKYSP